MNIPCSYGEIIDKLTILEIKLSKATIPSQINNIKKEYSLLSHHKKVDEPFMQLYNQLKHINMKLWDYEDKIRLKSRNKEFDAEYISIGEGIHQTNDERYAVKKRINQIYHSSITEEKIYQII